MHISKSKRCFDVKSLTYYFHLKMQILADFQICISVPLIYTLRGNKFFYRAMAIYIHIWFSIQIDFDLKSIGGCSYGVELARLSGLARLSEMIFNPRSYGIFCLRSIKKFVMPQEKDYLIKYFLQQHNAKPLFN